MFSCPPLSARGHAFLNCSNNPTKRQLIVYYALVYISIVALLLGLVSCNKARVERIRIANERVKSTVNALSLGMSIEEVESVLKEHGWPEYKVNRSSQSFGNEVSREFGNHNWFLFLIFDKDSLVSIRVRTDNATCEHPKDAPKDVDLEGFTNDTMRMTEIKWEF
jgi:hypothetical protein